MNWFYGTFYKNKQRIKVAKIYEKITNSRNDMLHKVSTEIVKNYDVISVESLNVKGMMKRCKPKQDENGKYLPNGQAAKSGLNKSIGDVAWGTFLNYLNYKSNWNDKIMVKIDRFFPSSKMCSKCHYIKQDLTLDIREWTCPICGTKHQRDFNAAKNIDIEGLNLLSVGTTEYTYGDGGYEVEEVGSHYTLV